MPSEAQGADNALQRGGFCLRRVRFFADVGRNPAARRAGLLQGRDARPRSDDQSKIFEVIEDSTWQRDSNFNSNAKTRERQ